MSFLTIQSDSKFLENFKNLPFLSSSPLGVFPLSLSYLFWLLLMGRLADLTSLASTAIPSLIVMPCFLNCRRISLLIWSMTSMDNLLLKRKNVEWYGEGLLKESRKNFLNNSQMDFLNMFWWEDNANASPTKTFTVSGWKLPTVIFYLI